MTTPERFAAYGFEECEFEPSACDECRDVKPLFFGDRDCFDSREGRYMCAECLDKRIEADIEFGKYVKECVEQQKDHEAMHMPWMFP